MFVIKYKKIFVGLSVLFVAVSIAFLFVFKLRFGIDFTGGSQITLHYDVRPDTTTLQTSLTNAGFGDARIQPENMSDVSVKTRALSDAERASLVAAATVQGHTATQTGFTSIGPSVGTELKHKAITALILVLLAIICFVAYAFRKVSEPVSSWKYGLVVIIALIHDVIIPSGVFALLGHVLGAEVDTLFIVALLTTLGLSVSDTIVVFDRIREHLKGAGKNKNFAELVGESLSERFVRCMNTSLVGLVGVLSLAILGPVSRKFL
jgi:preprotein translocase subunit SecF